MQESLLGPEVLTRYADISTLLQVSIIHHSSSKLALQAFTSARTLFHDDPWKEYPDRTIALFSRLAECVVLVHCFRNPRGTKTYFRLSTWKGSKYLSLERVISYSVRRLRLLGRHHCGMLRSSRSSRGQSQTVSRANIMISRIGV